jgi:prolyl-tRNA editing enzyme YbaK/EbsC (Cys-tRNA(Pro) deacylase)
MSCERAFVHLEKLGLSEHVRVFDVSSATVREAALALGTDEARIAKSLTFQLDDGVIIVVAAGDVKVDNRKFKDHFGKKAKMLKFEEVEPLIGHAVGGVCPFGINDGVRVYLDESLKRFETVFPAVGSANSAVELDLEALYLASGAIGYIDVTTAICPIQ